MKNLIFTLSLILAGADIFAAPCDDVPPRVQMLSLGQLDKLRQEFEAGKRDERDGYIILNQLRFRLSGRKDVARPGELEHIEQQKADILKRHPEFPRMRDWRLSDTIACEEREEAAKAHAIKKALEWQPLDNVPIVIFGQNRHGVAVYQFKIAFFDLPNGVEVRETPGWNAGFFRDGKVLNPAELTPRKVITFKRAISVSRFGSPLAYKNLLVCTTTRKSTYTPRSKEEIDSMAPLHARFWIDKQGAIGKFYGVISLKGDILAEFQVGKLPDGWGVFPIAIAPEGDLAAIVTGQDSHNPEEEIPGPQHLWIWRAPDSIKHSVVQKRINIGLMIGKVNDHSIGKDAP